MKNLEFNIELEFDNEIYSDNEIEEVMNNILQSLVHTTNTSFLAPENSDNFTKKITVSNNLINSKFIKKI